MTQKERYNGVLQYFIDTNANDKPELIYRDEFSLLVAVILSAQCTDKRVNMVTPALIDAYPTAEAMAKASVEDILHYIKSVSYPNAKARHLQGMAQALVEHFLLHTSYHPALDLSFLSPISSIESRNLPVCCM